MRVWGLSMVAMTTATACFLIASCSVFGGENDTDTSAPSPDAGDGLADAPPPTPDGAAVPDASADARAKEGGACECGAGTICTDAGTCRVTAEPKCTDPIAVPAKGGRYEGTVCSNNATSIVSMCSGETRKAHVFLMAPNATVSQAKVKAVDGDFNMRIYGAGCGAQDGNGCINVSRGASDVISVQAGEAFALGYSGISCRKYEVEFN